MQWLRFTPQATMLCIAGCLLTSILNARANTMIALSQRYIQSFDSSRDMRNDTAETVSSHRREGWISVEINGGLLSRSQEGPGSVDRGESGLELGAMYLLSSGFGIGAGLGYRRSASKNPLTGYEEDQTVHIFLNLIAFPMANKPLFVRGGIGSASVFYSDDPTERMDGWAARLGFGYELRLDDRVSLQPSLTSTWTQINDFPGSPPEFSNRRDRYLSLNLAVVRNLPGKIPSSPEDTHPLDRLRAFTFMVGYSQLGQEWDPFRGHIQFGAGGWIRFDGWPVQLESMFLLSIHSEGTDTIPKPGSAALKTPPVRDVYSIAKVTGELGSSSPGTFLVDFQMGIRHEFPFWNSSFSGAIGAGVSGIYAQRRPQNMRSDNATAAGLYTRWMVLYNSMINRESFFAGIMVQGETSTEVLLQGSRFRVNAIGLSFIAGFRI